MSSQLFDLSAGFSGYSAVAFAVGLVVVTRLSWPSKLDAIPTAGSSNWFGAWWAGLTFMTNALDVIQEGYEKHNKAPFKVAALYRWLVILSSREHVEELRKAPDDTLSFLDGINDELQLEYTMGHGTHYNPYHIPILRSKLTRSIGALYPEIKNEIIIAFDEILDLQGNEWKSVPAFGSVQNVICRTINRVFVGLPLCRDPDWIDLNIQICPLCRLAVRLFTNIIQYNERGRKLLGPVIEERQRYLAEYGEQWADKPNDLVSWLMEEAKGEELTVEALTTRILATNFAAIHTSSTSFTNALFYLAANPKYMQPLREEVAAIIHKEGWTKAAVDKMQKVDSFLRESERMQGFSGVSLIRKVLKDFTFSDGTFVPRGTKIAAATRSVHYDEGIYPNAHVFQPFRFADLSEEADGELRHKYVSTTTEYLAFGHGRHACPGRFFAANELKSMLAHVVMTYDVKLEDNTTRPQTIHIGTSMLLDPYAMVMFRKRVE